MSKFYGVEYANTFINEPQEANDVSLVGGRLRYMSGSFTAAAIIDTTDKVFLGRLPKGARIIEVLFSSDDMGTTGDFNVGWDASPEEGEDGSTLEVADADGFYAALDVNTAAISRTAYVSTVAGFRKRFAGKVDIVVAPSEITTNASGAFFIEIYYVLD
jgi:hypothetical protein